MKLRELRRHEKRLGFQPQPAVRWLSPGELWRTAIKVLLSWVFANYSDKREIQANLKTALLKCPAGLTADTDPQPELWLDFVADIGDGFDATYTVAALVARPSLDVTGLDGSRPLHLPRAQLLVLGGDEVYPTPSERGYEDRTKGPYRAALPHADPRPMMLAVPGNHDWYDGMTAFLRVFVQGRYIGGWRTAQNRSYFAVQLPHGWWLLGVDSQLGTYIDEPQINFFRECVSPELRPGAGVIICSATPTWVHTAESDIDAFDQLHYFDWEVVRRRRDPGTGEMVETGASVRLWITGDRHHYARYEEDAPEPAGPGTARQLITCGLGGAYLSATHALPAELSLPPADSRLRRKDKARTFTLRSRYPDTSDSRRMSWGLLSLGSRGLARRNPGFWQLATGVHVVLFLILSSLFGVVHRTAPMPAIRTGRPMETLVLGGWLLAALVAMLVVPALLRRLGRRPGRTHWFAFGAAALQLAVGIGGLALATAVPWPAGWSQWTVLGWCLAGVLLFGGLIASFAFAFSIRLARRGMVADWQMSAQSIEDHKGFVRMHIDRDGRLTLYPLCVDRVCHDWRLVDADDHDLKRPVPAGPLPRPRLIEQPVVITRGGTGGA